ncbi:MAG: glycosyltransferase family 4 protein [Nitrospinota bacterium]
MNMRDRLNILVVTDVIFPDEEAGSGRVAWELSRNLTRRGYQVAILTCGKPGLPENEKKEEIEIWRFQNNLFKYRKFFQHLNNTHNFDVICFNHPFSSLGVLTLRKGGKIPSVYIFYSPWAEEYHIRSEDLGRGYLKEKIGIWLRKYFENMILKKSKWIIVLSSFIKERLITWHNFPPEKIKIIPAGVDLERFKPSNIRGFIRSKLNLPEDRFILLTVRNLVSRMGLENLIIAIKNLVNSYPGILLVIGGKGYLEKRLKEIVIELNLGRWVHFAGLIPDELLPEYYQIADIFILPTKTLEGFGLITLEALACGTPVLATPIGANIEILEKFEKGLLFKGIEPEDIALGIRELLDHKDRYEDLRERCRKFIEENYSWDKFTDEVESIFHEIIKS